MHLLIKNLFKIFFFLFFSYLIFLYFYFYKKNVMKELSNLDEGMLFLSHLKLNFLYFWCFSYFSIETICVICFEPPTDPIILKKCKHQFCTECLKMLFDQSKEEDSEKKIKCPLCRTQINDDDTKLMKIGKKILKLCHIVLMLGGMFYTVHLCLRNAIDYSWCMM